MLVETGVFGGGVLPNGIPSEIFEASVVIPETEFVKLGIRQYERPGRLLACFQECLDSLGAGGCRWSVMLRNEDHA